MQSSHYADTFRALQPAYDPRHIEAFVRLQYSTLNQLDRRTLVREAKIAALCVEQGGADAAEKVAQSFGL